MMLLQLFFAFLAPSLTDATSSCAEGYSLCSPPGASSTIIPQIGSLDFPNLYTNILSSSLPSLSSLRRSEPSTSSASLCCNALLSCLLIANLSIPFCYDKFTTNFFLPDGSYGTLFTGSYTSSSGDTANLTTGEYVLLSGEKGTIYATPGTPTHTHAPPSPFTSSGIGSAIPASSLGKEITVTYITSFAGTTIPAMTIQPSTSYNIVKETILYPVVVDGSTIAATATSTFTKTVLMPGTTVAGITSVGEVRTVTTTSASAAAATGTGARQNHGSARMMVGRWWMVVVVWGMLLPWG